MLVRGANHDLELRATPTLSIRSQFRSKSLLVVTWQILVSHGRTGYDEPLNKWQYLIIPRIQALERSVEVEMAQAALWGSLFHKSGRIIEIGIVFECLSRLAPGIDRNVL
ncbi:MAG: hypothetical protein EXS05_23465 [Planctomycetaceae bacterium]|nr:hypothetical protein [Planctomycetaceae bacterium]